LRWRHRLARSNTSILRRGVVPGSSWPNQRMFDPLRVDPEDPRGLGARDDLRRRAWDMRTRGSIFDFLAEPPVVRPTLGDGRRACQSVTASIWERSSSPSPTSHRKSCCRLWWCLAVVAGLTRSFSRLGRARLPGS
jgi:hypothetical protein